VAVYDPCTCEACERRGGRCEEVALRGSVRMWMRASPARLASSTQRLAEGLQAARGAGVCRRTTCTGYASCSVCIEQMYSVSRRSTWPTMAGIAGSGWMAGLEAGGQRGVAAALDNGLGNLELGTGKAAG
jgi:hypothetical protein